MSSRFLSLVLLCLSPISARVLRVCSDPDNLPFSSDSKKGFENRVAELLARELGATLEYIWWPQRKFFIEKSLNQGNCDVLLGVPTALDSVAATAPYYRSTYVFVYRKDRKISVSSLFDAALEKYRIGVQIVGDDYAPPAIVLARRGLAPNVAGPPARIINGVVRGDIDVAIVWGPFAGYLAKREQVPLEVTPVTPAMVAGMPFTYDISAAVRKQDTRLKAEIDRALTRECETIQSILTTYGIPQVPEEKPRCESSQSASASLR